MSGLFPPRQINWRSFYDAFRSWNKRNFATWWLWAPLLFGSYAFVDRQDRWADMYEVARTAPRFVREGIVDDIGIRGRWMELKTDRGTRRISCEAAPPRQRDTYCLPRKYFPMRITVTLVDYGGVWLIISASDSKGNVVLREQDHMKRLNSESEYSKRQTLWTTFKSNFLFIFIPGAAFSIWAKYRLKKLHGVKK